MEKTDVLPEQDLEKGDNSIVEKPTEEEDRLLPENRSLPVYPKQETSPYRNKHRIIVVLLGLQVLTWVIGVECICLLANACDLFGSKKQELNQLSTIDPAVPDGGASVLLPTAFVFSFVVVPMGIYLTATEVRGTIRAWGVLSFCLSGYLLGMCGVYFSRSKKMNAERLEWDVNFAAQRYYKNSDAAVSAAKRANNYFALVFMCAGVILLGGSLFACAVSGSFPKRAPNLNAFGDAKPSPEDEYKNKRKAINAASSIELPEKQKKKEEQIEDDRASQKQKPKEKKKKKKKRKNKEAPESESDIDQDL